MGPSHTLSRAERLHAARAPRPERRGLSLDPVCGMWVKPSAAKGVSRHLGRDVHFCTARCKTAFDARPFAYLPAPAH